MVIFGIVGEAYTIETYSATIATDRLASLSLRVVIENMGTLVPFQKRHGAVTIELEENTKRKGLTSYELSKNIVKLADVAEKVLPKNGKTAKGGRPSKTVVEYRHVATALCRDCRYVSAFALESL